MFSQASVPDVVARGGVGSPLDISLKKIGKIGNETEVSEIEAMLSIRLHQWF